MIRKRINQKNLTDITNSHHLNGLAKNAFPYIIKIIKDDEVALIYIPSKFRLLFHPSTVNKRIESVICYHYKKLFKFKWIEVNDKEIENA